MELTLDEYKINDGDVILFVEQNDINQINNILKTNQNSSNSNKMIIPRGEINFNNNLSSENQNNLIILNFFSTFGIQSRLKFNKNITIKEALKSFCQGIGLSPLKMESLTFLYNASFLSINDESILGRFFSHFENNITVIDNNDVIGA